MPDRPPPKLAALAARDYADNDCKDAARPEAPGSATTDAKPSEADPPPEADPSTRPARRVPDAACLRELTDALFEFLRGDRFRWNVTTRDEDDCLPRFLRNYLNTVMRL